MSNEEFEDDVVFARFLNYMQIALLHRKLDYERHLEVIKKREEKINYVGHSKYLKENHQEKMKINIEKIDI